MQNYIFQLLADIKQATENICKAYEHKQVDFFGWISEEEEEQNAPIKNLQDYCGIMQEQLPPENMLSDGQLAELFSALRIMLQEIIPFPTLFFYKKTGIMQSGKSFVFWRTQDSPLY